MKKRAFSGIGFILAMFIFFIVLFITTEYYNIFTIKESVDMDISRALDVSVNLAVKDIDWIKHNSVMDTEKAKDEFQKYLLNDMNLNSRYEKYSDDGELVYQIFIDDMTLQKTPAKFEVSGRIRMKPVTLRSVLPESFDVPFSAESKNTRYDD